MKKLVQRVVFFVAAWLVGAGSNDRPKPKSQVPLRTPL